MKKLLALLILIPSLSWADSHYIFPEEITIFCKGFIGGNRVTQEKFTEFKVYKYHIEYFPQTKYHTVNFGVHVNSSRFDNVAIGTGDTINVAADIEIDIAKTYKIRYEFRTDFAHNSYGVYYELIETVGFTDSLGFWNKHRVIDAWIEEGECIKESEYQGEFGDSEGIKELEIQEEFIDSEGIIEIL
jgi:hypothetical protein|tara:strand:+ start:772 stop:1332 length:561 start_codon:yes stop_codon:yes gene_type:complete